MTEFNPHPEPHDSTPGEQRTRPETELTSDQLVQEITAFQARQGELAAFTSHQIKQMDMEPHHQLAMYLASTTETAIQQQIEEQDGTQQPVRVSTEIAASAIWGINAHGEEEDPATLAISELKERHSQAYDQVTGILDSQLLTQDQYNALLLLAAKTAGIIDRQADARAGRGVQGRPGWQNRWGQTQPDSQTGPENTASREPITQDQAWSLLKHLRQLTETGRISPAGFSQIMDAPDGKTAAALTLAARTRAHDPLAYITTGPTDPESTRQPGFFALQFDLGKLELRRLNRPVRGEEQPSYSSQAVTETDLAAITHILEGQPRAAQAPDNRQPVDIAGILEGQPQAAQAPENRKRLDQGLMSRLNAALQYKDKGFGGEINLTSLTSLVRDLKFHYDDTVAPRQGQPSDRTYTVSYQAYDAEGKYLGELEYRLNRKQTYPDGPKGKAHIAFELSGRQINADRTSLSLRRQDVPITDKERSISANEIEHLIAILSISPRSDSDFDAWVKAAQTGR